MNINYFDALSDPQGNEPPRPQIDRFLGSAGGHALAGWNAWHLLPQSLWLAQLERRCGDHKTQPHDQPSKIGARGFGANSLTKLPPLDQVFARYRQLLSARSSSPAFHPHGTQKILDMAKRIFAVLRTSPDETKQVLCLQNVSAQDVQMQIPNQKAARDLLTNHSVDSKIVLKPYQTLWFEVIL
jgi:glucosylglycerate phosphorylase